MGGGAGTRLFPLTKDRAKPAVPLGGKYRLVDIPISNCLNSGLRSIYVLTQFNTMSTIFPVALSIFLPLNKRLKVRSGIKEPPTLCGKICATSSSDRLNFI